MSETQGAALAATGASPGLEEGPITLALSGGGFRATLFHLGVIRYLQEHDLLRRVRQVCSVSGGSVLAAHLALNWEGYFTDFDKTADHLLNFIRSDVRGRVVRKWLFSWTALPLRLLPRFRRSLVGLLEAEYAGLFGGKSLHEMKRRGETPVPPPEIALLAASMTTGRLCAFDSAGFRIVDRRDPASIDNGEISVALAVAASSAFPALFGPVPIDHRRLGCPYKEFHVTEYLTDGGVFENLGLWMLRHLHSAGRLPGAVVLASDAQLPFDWEGQARFAMVFARATRTTDVLMKRITEFEYQTAELYFREKLVNYQRCKGDEEIPSEDDPKALPPPLPRKAAMIRTDLNRFSEEEIDALLRHGYAHARRACLAARLVPAGAANQPWSPVKPDQQVKPGGLAGSERQPKGLLAWDRYTLGYVPLLLLWLAGVAVGVSWLTNAPGRAYRALFCGPVSPSFQQEPVENLAFVKGEDLTPTVRQAKDLLKLMAGDAPRPVYLQLKAKLSSGGRPTTQAARWLAFPRSDDIPEVGPWVFRVRTGQDGHLSYEALYVTRAHDKDGKEIAGKYQFVVPPAEPGDTLLVLAGMKLPMDSAVPADLNTLIRLEEPK